MTTVDDCGFELTDHPPYSPDLASTDFRLFPNLNKYLVSVQFTTDHAVMIAVETHFNMQNKASSFQAETHLNMQAKAV